MKRLLIVLLGLICLGDAAADSEPAQRTLLGYIESIVLEPAGLPLKARLDTGAHTSSLHSADTVKFKRDGEDWVRFHVPVENHRNADQDEAALRVLVFERPIKRVVLVKRKGAASQQRYVVDLSFCLDGREYETEFSLTDRSAFQYPALLGRQILKDAALVDPANSFLAKETCAAKALEEFDDQTVELEAEDQDDNNEDAE